MLTPKKGKYQLANKAYVVVDQTNFTSLKKEVYKLHKAYLDKELVYLSEMNVSKLVSEVNTDSEKWLAAYFSNPTAKFIVLYVDSNPAGYVAVDCGSKTSPALLTELFLHEEYRSQGFGHKLVEMALEHAKLSGAKQVEATTLNTNWAGKAALTGSGFKPAKTTFVVDL